MRILAKVYKDGSIDHYILSDGSSVTRESIVEYRGVLSDVKIMDNGLVIADYAIDELFPDVSVSTLDFKRDVSSKLESWLKYDSDLVLFLKGMRQVGKTYEIKRFADSHFKNVVYLNLSVDNLFIERVKQRKAKGVLQLVSEYCAEMRIPFTNDKNTIFIIDEIQISLEVFNLVRALRNDLGCCVAITGSYLGFLVNRKSFHAAGDILSVEMTPLTFNEFCIANGVTYEFSDKARELYDVYRQIGGFPAVVKEYIKTRSIQRCINKVEELWGIFCQESDAYIDNTPCEELFNECMSRVIYQISTEKTGFEDLVNEELSVRTMTSYLGDTPIVSNKDLKQGYTWLVRSGILGKCKMHKDGEVRKTAGSIRYYIRDTGLANYIIRSIGQDSATREGTLTECFVYNELRNSAASEIAGGVPHCALFQGYELDFIFVDATGDTVVGVEVKTNNGQAKSLSAFLKKNLINVAIKAGMFEYQVHTNKLVNYPVYLIGTLSIESIKNDLGKLRNIK